MQSLRSSKSTNGRLVINKETIGCSLMLYFRSVVKLYDSNYHINTFIIIPTCLNTTIGGYILTSQLQLKSHFGLNVGLPAALLFKVLFKEVIWLFNWLTLYNSMEYVHWVMYRNAYCNHKFLLSCLQTLFFGVTHTS